MKFICTDNFLQYQANPGISYGLEYLGQLVINEKGRLQVAIWNDLSRWEIYDADQFKPA
jgi:hypothetical protein